MSTFAELDRLSSKELHDRAIHRAEHHLDARFFWEVLEMIPVAEAAEGRVGAADGDIARPSRLLNDDVQASEGHALLEGLRPVFIDHLLKHPEEPPAGA